MSRVGKKPVPLPDGVTATLDGQRCNVSGPLGTLEIEVHDVIRVGLADGALVVTRPSDTPSHRSLHGMTRALLANMVHGVSEGFEKTLEIVGTGYRAELRGSTLVLTVGFSHLVEMEPLEGATFEVQTPQRIRVSGIDKQVVGQQAALVRRVRPPEPYRGKGIRYAGEYVRIKAGKTVGTVG